MAENWLQENELDTQQNKYLTFLLGQECYGIAIQHVTEIIGLQPFTEVPELPAYVRGIINLRGRIIPVLDVRMRFKKPFQEYTDRTCIIVVSYKDIAVGLIVDGVSEVLDIPETDIVPPPELNHSGNRYVEGIGKVGDAVKLLLDCQKLLGDDEAAALAQVEQ